MPDARTAVARYALRATRRRRRRRARVSVDCGADLTRLVTSRLARFLNVDGARALLLRFVGRKAACEGECTDSCRARECLLITHNNAEEWQQRVMTSHAEQPFIIGNR